MFKKLFLLLFFCSTTPSYGQVIVADVTTWDYSEEGHNYYGCIRSDSPNGYDNGKPYWMCRFTFNGITNSGRPLIGFYAPSSIQRDQAPCKVTLKFRSNGWWATTDVDWGARIKMASWTSPPKGFILSKEGEYTSASSQFTNMSCSEVAPLLGADLGSFYFSRGETVGTVKVYQGYNNQGSVNLEICLNGDCGETETRAGFTPPPPVSCSTSTPDNLDFGVMNIKTDPVVKATSSFDIQCTSDASIRIGVSWTGANPILSNSYQDEIPYSFEICDNKMQCNNWITSGTSNVWEYNLKDGSKNMKLNAKIVSSDSFKPGEYQGSLLLTTYFY